MAITRPGYFDPESYEERPGDVGPKPTAKKKPTAKDKAGALAKPLQDAYDKRIAAEAADSGMAPSIAYPDFEPLKPMKESVTSNSGPVSLDNERYSNRPVMPYERDWRKN